jgi:hypothetical protein
MPVWAMSASWLASKKRRALAFIAELVLAV